MPPLPGQAFWTLVIAYTPTLPDTNTSAPIYTLALKHTPNCRFNCDIQENAKIFKGTDVCINMLVTPLGALTALSGHYSPQQGDTFKSMLP